MTAIPEESGQFAVVSGGLGVGGDEGPTGRRPSGFLHSQCEGVNRDVAAGFEGPVEELGAGEVVCGKRKNEGLRCWRRGCCHSGFGCRFAGEIERLTPAGVVRAIFDLDQEATFTRGNELEVRDSGLIGGCDPCGIGL